MRSLLLFSFLLLLGGCSDRKQPNVIVVTLDTTRADRLGAYGYEGASTPTMDRLAESGFVFERHTVPVPITLPSHTSLFTGLYPPQHGVRDNGAFVADGRLLTLAEAFAAHGYQTGAAVGSFPVTRRFGLDQGFHFYDDDFTAQEPTDVSALGRLGDMFFEERPASAVVTSAINWLSSLDAEPFFLWVHVFDAHQPLNPPSPFDRNFVHDLYDGEIAFIDSQMARLVDFLEEMEIDDDTLIFITADHGEALGEHGEISHAMLLHQATLHVPLIVTGPGVPVGRSSEFTDSTQVARTILDLANIRSDDTLSKDAGLSLVPVLNSNGIAPSWYPTLHSYAETLAPRLSYGWNPEFSWTEGASRYVHAPNPLLFDLETDVLELQNLHDSDPGTAELLHASLEQFVSVADTGFSVLEAGNEAASIAHKLAALGYIMPDQDDLKNVQDLLQMDAHAPAVRDRVADIAQHSAAKAAMASGNVELAIELNRLLLDRSPKLAQAWESLALAYAQIGRRDRSIESIDQAIALSPSASLWNFKGGLHFHFGEMDAALAALRHDDAYQQSSFAMALLGRVMVELGHDENALDVFQMAVESDPKSPFYRLYFANSAARLSRRSEAESAYRELVELDPYFPLGLYNFAVFLASDGRLDAARTLLERVRYLSPQYQPALEQLRTLASDA